MKLFLAIFFGKITKILSKLFSFGKGSSAPGLIALKIDKDIIEKLSLKIKKPKILISATNGKTTTTKLLCEIIERKNKVISNYMGANLERAVTGALIEKTSLSGKLRDSYLVFEIDEAVLPKMIRKIKPDIVILGNLFRDQLDRYGELETLANKWKNALKNLSYCKSASKSKNISKYIQSRKDQDDKYPIIILNADDPLVASLGKKLSNVYYFGIKEKYNSKNISSSADSIYCPYCQTKLIYKNIIFSHLGEYKCKKCDFNYPKLDIYAKNILFKQNTLQFDTYFEKEKIDVSTNLTGNYNIYNILSAILASKILKINTEDIKEGIKKFSPAFGRMEEFNYKNKKFKIILIKNPTGANAALDYLKLIKNKKILIGLNDNIADGKDISWIWDVDWEKIVNCTNSHKSLRKYHSNTNQLICIGSRKYDLALRLKYTGLEEKKIKTGKDYLVEIEKLAKLAGKDETIYLLLNYTAMLELRKKLEKKKIVSKL